MGLGKDRQETVYSNPFHLLMKLYSCKPPSWIASPIYAEVVFENNKVYPDGQTESGDAVSKKVDVTANIQGAGWYHPDVHTPTSMPTPGNVDIVTNLYCAENWVTVRLVLEPYFEPLICWGFGSKPCGLPITQLLKSNGWLSCKEVFENLLSQVPSMPQMPDTAASM